MKLSIIDLTVIILYLTITVILGLVLKKIAQKDKKSYLLGSNQLPWYMLGLSNASGMFDISGTMWLVTLAFVYGMKSIWIPWLWPVFNQIFLMVYLSAWLRRSKVTTGAEWIVTRFGTDRGARLSHNIVVVFALISCLGFMGYGFIGLGKFIEIFIPWETIQPYIPFNLPAAYVPHFYGILITAFAVFYTLLGGMLSIVWADVLQYLIMTVASIVIGIIAMLALSSHVLHVPEGWFSPFFGLKLNMDWTGIINKVNDKIKSDGYSLFSLFFSMMLFKGILVSAAGPAPNYDMQKILSTKSPREASLMSGFVTVVLMPVRYFMIAGFAILGLLFYDKLDLVIGGRIDFEQVLPSAINEFAPVGLLGLLIAGLMAAFMGTFSGTLNAAQAYIINDVYLKYINPTAKKHSLKLVNYASGLLVVVISIIIGIFALDVNDLLQWIVSALWGSYMVSNVLKWYWWRFNGHGYFWGMISGIIAALIFPYLFENILDLYYFPLIMVISLAGSLLATYLMPATDEKTLISFYSNVRPWGFWKPVLEKVKINTPEFKENKDFKRDLFNVFTGTIWQLAIMALPVYIVLLKWDGALLTGLIILITSVVLWKTWYLKLNDSID